MTGILRFDPARFNAILDAAADRIEEAARPAAQAAAQVIYDEVKRNVGRLGRKTGNLERSIYQYYDKTKSVGGIAHYKISWNTFRAPHGHLVEYGHIQKYKYARHEDGKIRPAVRPEMKGRPKPGKYSSVAERDAYYVLLPTPIHVAAQPFMRNARSKIPDAIEAAKQTLMKELNGLGE